MTEVQTITEIANLVMALESLEESAYNSEKLHKEYLAAVKYFGEVELPELCDTLHPSYAAQFMECYSVVFGEPSIEYPLLLGYLDAHLMD